MRIVGGKYKGRVLADFSKIGVRPTSDMARESLFNIIQFEIAGSSFLDLFAGTGAIGIEAMSRGASFVCFNDNSKESIKLLKGNLEKIKATENYKITNLDALTFIESTDIKFDFIYLDAPYLLEIGKVALDNCYKILKENGRVIYENQTPFNDIATNLIKTDERRYGRAYLTFFRKNNE